MSVAYVSDSSERSACELGPVTPSTGTYASVSRMPSCPGVYFVRCVYGRVYTGSSKNMRARVMRHYALLRRGVHPVDAMQRDWRRFGADGFVCGVLAVCGSDDEELSRLEEFWIGAMGVGYVGGSCGYNVSTVAKRGVGRVGPRKRVLVPGKVRG